jgi:hypothetical protein
LKRCERNGSGEETICFGTLKAEGPRLDRLIAGGLSPGIEDLHQPALDFSGVHARVACGAVNLGTIFSGGGQGDQAAVGAVRLIVGVDGLPEGDQGLEERFATLGLVDFMEQVERGLPIDFLAFEDEVVGVLDEADQQSRAQ